MRIPWRPVALAGALVAAALPMFAAGDSDFLLLRAGPTPATAEAVRVTAPAAADPAPATGKLLITTVTGERMSRWAALRCQARPTCAAIPVVDAYADEAQEQMRRAVSDADRAATMLAGDLARWPQAPGKVSVPGIGGPSAGVALTLHLLDARVPGDLLAGKTVAATGTVTSTGSVGVVGGVPLKAHGARAGGAAVFFVPEAEAAQARAAEPALQVVPVASVRDAVRWLCEHGAASDLCG